MKRVLMVLGLAVLAMAVLAGTAPGKGKKPALQITVPPSVTEGSTWSIQATGRSGKFNRIGFHAFLGGSCAATEAGMEQAGSTGIQATVGKNKKFNKSQAFTASNPGTHHACVYLYQSSNPGGGQLTQGVAYTVTPAT